VQADFRISGPLDSGLSDQRPFGQQTGITVIVVMSYVSHYCCDQMNGSSHPTVPGLKLGDLAESAAENNPLSPVAGKQICSNGGFDDTNAAVVLPAASRRTTDNKVNSWICLDCIVENNNPNNNTKN